MGSIADEHVEWAMVNRLKAMLDTPPETKFNVTQSFALFSAILLWTKQRAWVRDHDLLGRADCAARQVRIALQAKTIFDSPWLLSKTRPHPAATDSEVAPAPGRINTDFEDMKVEQFIRWVRNALAHGDGRTIKPIHIPSRTGSKTYLAGFEVVAAAEKAAERTFVLSLYHSDMTRIGTTLAHTFCQALSGGSTYFEEDAGTRSVEEAA
jgi:hypothetical protein